MEESAGGEESVEGDGTFWVAYGLGAGSVG